MIAPRPIKAETGSGRAIRGGSMQDPRYEFPRRHALGIPVNKEVVGPTRAYLARVTQPPPLPGFRFALLGVLLEQDALDDERREQDYDRCARHSPREPLRGHRAARPPPGRRAGKCRGVHKKQIIPPTSITLPCLPGS